MVKSKTASIIKDKPAAPVKIKPEKAEPELDISERLEKLHKQPPAFLRNAISKVEKLKKGDKSKKPKAEVSYLKWHYSMWWYTSHQQPVHGCKNVYKKSQLLFLLYFLV